MNISRMSFTKTLRKRVHVFVRKLHARKETLLSSLQEAFSAHPTWHGKTENSRTAKLIQRLQDIIGAERPSVSTAAAALQPLV